MTITMSKPHTTDTWYSLSSALTKYVNAYHFGKKRDLIVYCFDYTEDGWEDYPAAWHRPSTGDIVINMGVVFREIQKHTRGHREHTSIVKLNSGSKMRVPNDPKNCSYHVAQHFEISNESKLLERQVKKNNTLIGVFPSLASNLDNKKITSVASINAVIAAHVLGVLLHETGHAVFSDYILSEWWQKNLSPYDRSILSMFDELRCESYQISRVGVSEDASSYQIPIANVRGAADLVVDPIRMTKDLESSKDTDGKVSVSAVALNSTLILGRTLYNVFTTDETQSLYDLVESIVGQERLESMFDIWRDYLDIKIPNLKDFKDIADRWRNLFPSDDLDSSIAIVVTTGEKGEPTDETGKVGSPGIASSKADHDENEDISAAPTSDTDYDSNLGDDVDYADDSDDSDDESDESDESDENDDVVDEKIDIPNLPNMFKTAAEETTETAKKNDKPITVTSPAVSYKRAKKTMVADVRVDQEDFKYAKQVARALQTLYLVGRDKFHVETQLPPGRLRSRAAVQNAANRKSGNQSRIEQWNRVRLTTNINPRLTVGIMTDCSGSQGWATGFSSRMTWILSRAFIEVNGRVAACAFGSTVKITARPDRLPTDKRIEVPAVESSEAFDCGFGAINYILNLTDRRGGVRLLFVITDGIFVTHGETEKCHLWIKELCDADCQVIWIHPNNKAFSSGKTVPKSPNVHPMPVDRYSVNSDPKKAIDDVIDIVTRALSAEKSKTANI